MQPAFAKKVIFLIALSLVVPESHARRLGNGRSVGRQAPVSRQNASPAPPYPTRPYTPPPAAPLPRVQPDYARQAAPMRPIPAAPAPARPWGGMVGGALLGLGLGSLLSSGSRNNNAPNQEMNNPANRDLGNSTGNSANGTDSAGNPNVAPDTAAAQQSTGSGLGSLLLWGILGLAAFFLIRRMRTRAAQRRF